MRVVAGLHKGRPLKVPPGRDVRPTSDRARQALFNILMHSPLVEMADAVVLDVFAGSGAVALEALSRGAARAFLFERNPAALAAIATNLAACKEEGRAAVVTGDATRPPPARARADFAFFDPPYGSGLAGPALEALAAQGWLADHALCVVEVAAAEPFTPPPGFALADQRTYGAAKLVFLTRA